MCEINLLNMFAIHFCNGHDVTSLPRLFFSSGSQLRMIGVLKSVCSFKQKKQFHENNSIQIPGVFFSFAKLFFCYLNHILVAMHRYYDLKESVYTYMNAVSYMCIFCHCCMLNTFFTKTKISFKQTKENFLQFVFF